MAETELKRIALGDQWAVLREDDTIPVYGDVLTEARQYNGTVALGFGAIVQDANNPPEVQPVVRLRMNLVAAQSLHGLLGQMIADALKPADTGMAN